MSMLRTERASGRKYELGPFRLWSDLELPELTTTSSDPRVRERQVSVWETAVPESLPGAVWVDPFCCLTATEWMLHVPGVARYFVRNGNEIQAQPEPGACPEDVRTYLLGSCFGVLCYQNGLLPLHASAVERHGRVTAFLGHSGAGKSTLAASLAQRGYRVISDDICLLESCPGRQWVVHPVAGWLKLWRATLERVGEPVRPENRVFSRHDKYRVYLGDAPDGDFQLENLVFLERPPLQTAAPPALRPLGNADALGRLMGLVYLSYFPEAAFGLPALFRLGAELLAQSKAWQLCAPLGWNFLDESLEVIQANLLAEPPPANSPLPHELSRHPSALD